MPFPFSLFLCSFSLIGILFGSSGTLFPFCFYSFNGPSNVCSNSLNIAYFAWNLKLFFAIITDFYHPFGYHRKIWMLGGWIIVLLLLLVLASFASSMTVTQWLITLLFIQFFMMFSDVPADGYSIELGKRESPLERGQILATCQRIRFSFCVVAGFIQAFLLNGPSTNDNDCSLSFTGCWSWGLTINQYYGLLFALIFCLTLPVLWLKEFGKDNDNLEGSGSIRTRSSSLTDDLLKEKPTTPNRNEESTVDKEHLLGEEKKYHHISFSDFMKKLWLILQNSTTFYLILFVIGSQGFSNFYSNVNITTQYYLIKLTNFQAGIATIANNTAIAIAIYLFQRLFIHYNWRITKYISAFITSMIGLLWILVYYNVDGLMNGWFTIFIDFDSVSHSVFIFYFLFSPFIFPLLVLRCLSFSFYCSIL
jgi:MFS family permease